MHTWKTVYLRHHFKFVTLLQRCCDTVVSTTRIFFRYVPAFFSHAVLNVDDSVAVAQEFQPFFSSLPYGL